MTTRREILIAFGALTVPLAGVAQQGRVPRLGILGYSNLEPALGLFRESLRELGYVEGKNIQIELRSAEGKPSSIDALAAELVRQKVDVILALQTPAAHAAKQATSSIPIVINAGDPVGTGLVASLARPGGNITGMSATTTQIAVKTLELIRDLQPAMRSVAVLANAADPFTKPFLANIQSAGQAMGVEIRPAMVRGPDDYDAAFAGWAKPRADAVIVQPSLQRARAIELAQKYRLISVSPIGPFADQGGLIAYAASQRDSARKLANYVDRILKGAKPADLPVEQPTTFDLVLNLKTAKALGLTIPPAVLFRADRVIE